MLAELKNLKKMKFDDMFTRRKVEQIHPSLSAFGAAVVGHSLVYLDLRWSWQRAMLTLPSDNALNPAGAKAICPLLSQCTTITTLKLNNTGVGPAGGEVRLRLAVGH